MALWLVIALMTGAAVLAVLWPLGRRRRMRAGSDLEVYRDQLQEIERDHAEGRIGGAEAEAARIEVARRLLAADAAPPHAAAISAVWRRRVAALLALLVLPLGAGALYLALGSPDLPGAPLAARLAAPPEERPIEDLVAQVEAHLARHPQDGRGWDVLGPVYLRLGRFAEAVQARRNALRLLGASAEREAGLGEALAAAGNGVVTAEAKDAFERALALDPDHVQARFFIGLAAEQDGRRGDAAAIWRELLRRAPPDAAWAAFVRQALDRVEGSQAPGAEDMAAAAQLPAAQRAEMVRGMVERLAERLKRDSSDLEGWLRLVRAYAVLGDRDRARAAVAAARRAFEAEPEKLRRLDDLVRGLGLKS